VDSNVIRNARNGDMNARDELGRWMVPLLRKYFKKRRVKDAEIDELRQATVAEVFAKLTTHAPEKPDAFKAWVLGFARMRLRAASNERRREHARAAKLQHQPASPLTSLAGQLAKTEQWRIFVECMQQLPDNYRAAIERYIEHGSRSLGLGGRWQLMRAKRRLRCLVEEARRSGLITSS
jgi:DNA-directed RNA polymerase specialized sigma24 family protein